MAGYRYSTLLVTLFSLPIIMLLEFSFNQIILPWKFLTHQLIFWVIYVSITAIWQVGTNGAHIYDGLIRWDCTNPEATSDCNPWKSLEFCLVMLGYQVSIYSLLVGLSFAKIKFCCRRSKQIISEPLMGNSDDSKVL